MCAFVSIYPCVLTVMPLPEIERMPLPAGARQMILTSAARTDADAISRSLCGIGSGADGSTGVGATGTRADVTSAGAGIDFVLLAAGDFTGGMEEAGAPSMRGGNAIGLVEANGVEVAISIGSRTGETYVTVPLLESPRDSNAKRREANKVARSSNRIILLCYHRLYSGISLMVEHQFSKLIAPVRFRYPAHQ